MSDAKKDLNSELTSLEETMLEADQFRTLEEQVADMKRRGIDPTQAYKDLDRKEEDADWGVMRRGKRTVNGSQKRLRI